MKVAAAVLAAVILGVAPAALAQNRTVTVDAGKSTGQIKSLTGVNGGPAPMREGLPNLVQQYRQTNIDMVRTHDYMGPTDIDARFEPDDPTLAWLVPDPTVRHQIVAAGNLGSIFPDWSKDPENPASYRFGPTDEAIAAIVASGAEVYYRIGRSWAAHNTPPPDFDKFASVVKHVEMHYNQGWAKGFHDHIRYWEFWNEPETFWGGPPAQFFVLYDKTARALKSAEPSLKVGGPALAVPFTAQPYREDFLDYCREHKVPLDFYSWHNYTDGSADPLEPARLAKQFRKIIDEHGFPQAESILSEYNRSADFTEPMKAELRSADNAAFVATTLIYLQDASVDRAIYYRGDASWMGLFDLEKRPYKPAYAIRAMGEMKKTPERIAATGGDDEGFAVLAGKSEDGRTVQILISNYQVPANYKGNVMVPPPEFFVGATLPDMSKVKLPPNRNIAYKNNAGYDLTIQNLPWGKKPFIVQRVRLSDSEDLAEQPLTVGEGGEYKISGALPAPGVELITLREKLNY
jgi:xylan 1,4-beta-xylosidase